MTEIVQELHNEAYILYPPEIRLAQYNDGQIVRVYEQPGEIPVPDVIANTKLLPPGFKDIQNFAIIITKTGDGYGLVGQRVINDRLRQVYTLPEGADILSEIVIGKRLTICKGYKTSPIELVVVPWLLESNEQLLSIKQSDRPNIFLKLLEDTLLRAN